MFQGQRVLLWALAMFGATAGLTLVVLDAATEAAKVSHDAAPAGPDAGASADGVLRVRAIEVVDGAGRVLMRMGADETGQAAIVTMNGAGAPVTFMGQQDGAGMIATFDAQGRAKVVIPSQ